MAQLLHSGKANQGGKGEFLLYCLFATVRWEKDIPSAIFTFIMGTVSDISFVVATRDIAYDQRMGEALLVWNGSAVQRQTAMGAY